MSPRESVAPLLASGARLYARLGGHAGRQFQIVILHDIPERAFEALDGFLDWVGRERGFLKPQEVDTWLARDGGTLGRTDRPPPCLLTFDDGFASSLTVAMRILRRHDLAAIFFVCPGLIDLPASQQANAVMTNVFRGRYASSVPRLMGWDELGELQTQGHVIGAHGLHHIRLSDARESDAEAEILGAGARLEERLGCSIDWYAYAFGDIASISAPALHTIMNRYRYCRSGIRGANSQANPIGLLNAQEINLDTSTAYQRAILDGALDVGYIMARRRLRAYARLARPLIEQHQPV